MAVGLVSRAEAQIKQTGWGSYEPKLVRGYRYALTGAGEAATAASAKLNRHPMTTFFGQDQKEFCYGIPVLDEVVRFTEPANAFGMTVTEVTYRYRLTNIPGWAMNPAVAQAFFLQNQLAAEARPQEAKMDLILTSDGWRSQP